SPREAKASVVIPTERKAAFEKAAKEFEAEIIFENSFQEDGIKFTAKPCTTPSILLDIESQKAIIGALTASPNGVFRMSDAMPGLVETSTNLSRVAISDGKLEVLYMTRCMVNYGKVELCAMIRSVWELAGARVKDEGDYNGWAPKMDSVLLATMSNSYKSLFGHTPEVKAIHAGLECGIIGALYTGMDMISVGPTLQYPHSPDERVDIASVAKFYKFLLFTLSKL
ncbi:MAG: M20/M25/M40 family metallo-hydrolase, partial [Mucinivorans sp.]